MDQLHAKSVVVGIDGSQAAICAALWAVGEAVSRDVPLHLLCVVGESTADGGEPDDMARDLAVAEKALRRAVAAIERTGEPVKLQTETVQGPPIDALLRASASAAMVCLGAIGLHHFQVGRLGSTAAALSMSGRCPVAIVRSQRNRPVPEAREIVVKMSTSSDDGALLDAAMEEARLRDGTLHAVFCDSAGFGDASHLTRWRRRYPDLGVESTAVTCSLVDHLARSHRMVQLVVVGSHDCEQLKELMGPAGSAVLQEAGCSVLVVNHRRHL